MTITSTGPRFLQVLAAALAVAIVVLAVLVLQRDPLPPPPTGESETVADSGAAPVVTAPREATYADASAAPADEPVRASPAPAAALLYGCVRRADGTPVEKGSLSLMRNGERVSYVSVQSQAFAFPSVPPGDYQVTTRIDDELPVQRDVHLAAPRTRLDLQLDAAWHLTVNAVTPDGAPLLEALRAGGGAMRFREGPTANAFAAPLAGDLPLSNMRTVDAGLGKLRTNDPFGRGATLPKQTIGVLTLPAGQPVHVALLLRSVLVAQTAVPADQPEVTFTLAPEAVTGKLATVRLRCVDASGKPVAGVRVGLSDRQSSGGGQPTGEDGLATVSGLVPGRLGLDVSHKELRAPRFEIDVGPGADLDLGDVVLQPTVSVPLSLEALGKEARVSWWPLDPLPNAAWHHREGSCSAENGPTTTFPFVPGRYLFLARDKTGASFTEFDLRAAPTAPLRFQLQPAGALRLVNEVRGGYALVRLSAPNGTTIYDREWTGTWTTTLQLPPGRYEVSITDLTNGTTRRTLELGRDGAELRVP